VPWNCDDEMDLALEKRSRACELSATFDDCGLGLFIDLLLKISPDDTPICFTSQPHPSPSSQ
jgi:hypothetical protein